VSTRTARLMTAATRQVEEAARFLGALSAAHLHKPCRDDGGDDVGDTVGTAAPHLVDGYRRLGRFLRSIRNFQETATTAAGRSNGHGHGPDHSQAVAPETGPDLRAALVEVEAPIGLLGELTDRDLGCVPTELNRFADGTRTLEQALDAMLAHQDAHLVALRRAVA
jgi:hypothetical protein